jgi:hypothetical protein
MESVTTLFDLCAGFVDVCVVVKSDAESAVLQVVAVHSVERFLNVCSDRDDLCLAWPLGADRVAHHGQAADIDDLVRTRVALRKREALREHFGAGAARGDACPPKLLNFRTLELSQTAWAD